MIVASGKLIYSQDGRSSKATMDVVINGDARLIQPPPGNDGYILSVMKWFRRSPE